MRPATSNSPYGEITCRACGQLYSPMSSDQPTTYISKRVNRGGMAVSVKVPVFACPNCVFKNFAYFPGDVPIPVDPRR